MNFLDTYDIAAPATPPTEQPDQPSLNQEVTQVIGQLGGFWRGFRQQSQTALEVARKDLGSVVVQAQKEISKLTAELPIATTTSTEPESSDTAQTTEPDEKAALKAADASSESTEDATSTTSIAGPSQTLFERLQSALPPHIVATVQNNLPETLKHTDLSQLGATLSSEFQRVQGVTRAQAEEYVHKSEILLREAVKEAGEVLREAVKVVPPEEQEANAHNAGMIWDGSDVWMLPAPSSSSSSSQTLPGTRSARQSGEWRAVATRAESLLKRLKQHPEIIRHDPEAEPAVKEAYDEWLATQIATVEGGIDGLQWSAKIEKALAEPGDGDALRSTRDILVPSEIAPSTFWLRYFFRVHQIERDEERRKALLQGSTETEEDFNWEDDDDDAKSPVATTQPKTSTDTSSTVAPPSQTTPVSANTSPRASDDGSYDLVSSQVSAAGDASPDGAEKMVEKEATTTDEATPKVTASGTDDDPDSDWE